MKRELHKIFTRMALVLLSGMLLVAAPALTGAQGLWDLRINEFLADPPSDYTGDANGDGEVSNTQDEFVEILNVTDHEIDISGWTFNVNSTVKHAFPEGTVLPAFCGVVVFGGGTPTGDFGGCLVQVASTGSLVLSNDGATITLRDGDVIIDYHTYGNEAAQNQSLNRYPEWTGIFTKHSEIPAAAGAIFSPGTMVDGSPFLGCPEKQPVVYLPMVLR